jgi:hypothetical protein
MGEGIRLVYNRKTTFPAPRLKFPIHGRQCKENDAAESYCRRTHLPRSAMAEIVPYDKVAENNVPSVDQQ